MFKNSQEKPVSREARASERVDVSMDVIVAVPGETLMTMKTGNMTQNGVFLISRNQKLPDVGTEVILTLDELLQSTEPTALVGRVIHKNEQGMGVELLGPVT
jgi:hypothetical protein